MPIKSLFQTEDHWAIWIGAAFLLIGASLFFAFPPQNMTQRHQQWEQRMEQEAQRAPFHTLAWHEAADAQQKIKGSSTTIGKSLGQLTAKPGGWSTSPLTALVLSPSKAAQKRQAKETTFQESQETLARLKQQANMAQNKAADQQFQDENLNAAAQTAIANWRIQHKKFSKISKKYKAKAYNKIPSLLALWLLLALAFGLSRSVMQKEFWAFLKGFAIVFAIGVVAYLLAGQTNMKTLGIGYAAWAILIGLLISNTIGTPAWIKPALQTELYIKTGLVLLGAEILFGKILSIGLPGIFVAWIVTPIVLISTYWFGQKVLKISSKTLNITISADMSVCGVSAAVATAAACQAKKEELTLAIGLSMIFTSVMMIVMPIAIKAMGMPEVLGGAWMGGTIDATGAVVAAGAFLGDTALNVAATIKMIQNILIGIVAFGVAIYFARQNGKAQGKDIGWGEIWLRFPKFILGFIGASILMSLLYSSLPEGTAYSIIDQGIIRGYSKNIRGWLFCLAFVSIGLSTNFAQLKKHFSGGKPLILYLCGQSFNLVLTLLMAYVMFYLVFSNITASI
ncbi:MAG: putative sulfate exporter family transporter [Bacteroidota bacterium]